MPEVVAAAQAMISGMSPSVRPGRFVFVTTADPGTGMKLAEEAIALFREAEGLSLLVSVEASEKEGLKTDQPMRCITLNVYSSLQGIGLTAAVANALAVHAIPCNIIAAFHHDYVVVPEELCEKAMQALVTLQSTSGEG